MKKATAKKKSTSKTKVMPRSTFVAAVTSKWTPSYVRKMFFARYPKHQNTMRKQGPTGAMERDFAWYLNGLLLDRLINEDVCSNTRLTPEHGQVTA